MYSFNVDFDGRKITVWYREIIGPSSDEVLEFLQELADIGQDIEGDMLYIPLQYPFTLLPFVPPMEDIQFSDVPRSPYAPWVGGLRDATEVYLAGIGQASTFDQLDAELDRMNIEWFQQSAQSLEELERLYYDLLGRVIWIQSRLAPDPKKRQPEPEEPKSSFFWVIIGMILTFFVLVPLVVTLAHWWWRFVQLNFWQ